MKVVALIPAYNPGNNLLQLLEALSRSELAAIVLVNDGSREHCGPIFNEACKIPKVTMLRHAINLGKGAALKTGLNYIACNYADIIGVVTADADGQHLVNDILEVARVLASNPQSLVIGTRAFSKNVPLRSRLGNTATKYLFSLLVGNALSDTQSGLRGIPMDFINKLLKIESNGYEFELDMLLVCNQQNRSIVEQDIQTVYSGGNTSSHFNPILDSMKIYFVLFRFMLASLTTAAVDYVVFILAFSLSSNILLSQSLARLFALFVNYLAVKRMVFNSDQEHNEVFPRYVLLVLTTGLLSYGLINLFVGVFALNVIAAKLFSELIIYLGNFTVQREFIFKNCSKKKKTDWNVYYTKPYRTASLTRQITGKTLVGLMQRFGKKGSRIAELGGGNSCFFDLVSKVMSPPEYHVIDNNPVGLEKFLERVGSSHRVYLHNNDILRFEADLRCDLVFSVGLIEHFTPEGTRTAVKKHFEMLKPEGIAIISFPTPTFLYRATRFLSEVLGLWAFHDERALKRAEVVEASSSFGTILFDRIIWPIIFTQRIMVLRKHG